MLTTKNKPFFLFGNKFLTKIVNNSLMHTQKNFNICNYM